MKTFELKIENLDHFGRGIARIDGIPVFVNDALPDELVKVQLTLEKKNFKEGKVIEYLEKSPKRICPQCPYYEQCGGCDLMHLSYIDQLQYKENKIKEIMKKFGIETSIEPIIGNDCFNYRNKVTLKVKEKVGYYQKKSYDIIPIDYCLIADKEINHIIEQLNTISLKNIEEIIIRHNSKESMLIFKTKGDININYQQFKNIDSIYVNDNKVLGKDYIIEKIDNLSFTISPQSFFQVNSAGMVKLYDKVNKYCNVSGKEKVLDLYCGTGTIGIYISKDCQEVLGIELNKQAIVDANKNKEINHLSNIQFKQGDVKDVIKKEKFQPDIVIVDPPRAGLDNDIINYLITLKSSKIVYVSCDPITLARDLKKLEEVYKIEEITPVDMFSNTYHVECVSLLKLK